MLFRREILVEVDAQVLILVDLGKGDAKAAKPEGMLNSKDSDRRSW